MTALTIEGLTVRYPLGAGRVLTAVDGASLSLKRGEIHALVGESGAGKTTIGAAVMGLIDPPGEITAGRILIEGKPIAEVRLGADIGAVFQDPMTSLNPLFRVESQLAEGLRHHLKLSARAARARSVELLTAVGIADPERCLRSYPHQLSGGQRQRVVIAAALSCDPGLVVADEPTTALDVSIQAQILRLMRDLANQRGIGVLLVTHNMGVVAEIADTVSILHRGRIVEQGPVASVLRTPQDAYAQALIGAVPRIDRRLTRFPVPGAQDPVADTARTALQRHTIARTSGAMIEVENLVVEYRSGGPFARKSFRAVDGVSFRINAGEVFGLVGESGCGKTTTAHVIAGLIRPTSGVVKFAGAAQTTSRARPVQMVFQDPYASLNPRLRVGRMLAEPILFYRLARTVADAEHDVATLLQAVGLDATAAERFPHAFSGGQRQRLAIARALGARPRVLICDEPTSSLDVSVQAQILNLLKDLRDATGLTLLLISHDLAVIRQMCDRIGVMQAGKIVELSKAETLFLAPAHAYTKSLLAAVPSLDALDRRGL